MAAIDLIVENMPVAALTGKGTLFSVSRSEHLLPDA
jgi:hypothetical protein